MSNAIAVLETQPSTPMAQTDQTTIAQPIPRIWEQRDGEPNKWYDMFTTFRSLGPNRSIRQAWQRWYRWEQKKQDAIPDGIQIEYSEQPSNNCYDMAREWQWVERAEAYDAWIRTDAERETLQLVRQWQTESTRDLVNVWDDLTRMWMESEDDMSKNQITSAMKTIGREMSTRGQAQVGIDVQIVLDKLPADLQAQLAQALKLT